MLAPFVCQALSLTTREITVNKTYRCSALMNSLCCGETEDTTYRAVQNVCKIHNGL